MECYLVSGLKPLIMDPYENKYTVLSKQKINALSKAKKRITIILIILILIIIIIKSKQKQKKYTEIRTSLEHLSPGYAVNQINIILK